MDFDLDNIDFDKAEKAVDERMDELDNEEAPKADNNCADGCTI